MSGTGFADAVVRDVIVVGGGAAGLSAAVCLARSRRKVTVIDIGNQRNLPAEGVHNFLTRDGISPSELARLGREEVALYGGEIMSNIKVEDLENDSNVTNGISFVATLSDGRKLRAKRVILASGLTDELPTLPRGLKERWGKDVLHCPYCHGYEVRDKTIGILLSDPAHGPRQALLFNQISQGNIKFFLNDKGNLIAEKDREKLVAMKVELIEGLVQDLVLDSDSNSLKGLRLEGGKMIPIDALGVQTKLKANLAYASSLGLTVTSLPVGDFVKTNTPSGRTDLKGLWAVGNVSDLMGQVVTCAANGLLAGADVNFDLVDEEAEAAVLAQAKK